MKSLALCTLRIKSGCTKFAPIKGQLILKCFFWYFQFSQKMNEKIGQYYYGTSSRIVCVRFLRKLKTPKRHFEVN